MIARLRLLAFFLVAGAIVAPASATVTVSFTDPERYTDAGKYYGQSETAQRELEHYLKDLGKRYLTPGQTLSVEVLDIDLAGHYEPWRSDLYQVRILRDEGDLPRMKLRYTLKAEDRILASGEESLADRGFLLHGKTSAFSDYLYEKRMLRDWFSARFGERHPAQATRAE